jgi:hypothetical protein
MASITTSLAQSYDDNLWRTLFGQKQDVPGDWTKHFRVGAQVGFNLKAQFSMSGTFDVSGNNPGATGVSRVDHVYDNGYVLVDASGNDGGLTWNWGYQSADQYDSGSQRLSFRATDSYTTSGNATENSGAQLGVDVAYGGHLTQWGRAMVGWEFGFGYLPVSIKDNQALSANVTRISHSFDVSGIQFPGLLGDPSPGGFIYEGTYDGPGALIGDVAQAGPGETIANVPLTGERALDVNVFSFRLGPTLHWELPPRFAVAVSAGAAFGIVSGDLKYNETLQFSDGSTANNQGKSGATEFAYGGYISGTLIYHAVKNGDLYLGVQYMPMTSTTFGSDGREAELDMSGALYISTGFNWPF